MELREGSPRDPAGLMPSPPDVEVDSPALPPVNVDDLRRSGKIAIWPYIMRDLPLSPVEALRLELRSREGHRAQIPKQSTAGARHPSVEYFPACLSHDGEHADPSTVSVEQEQGPRTDSDLDALREKLSKVQLREQELLSTGKEPPVVLRKANGVVVSPPHARSSNAWPDGIGSKHQQLLLSRRRRPSSSGPGRRPRTISLEDESSSLLRRETGDRIECPSGCGEQVRVTDLGHHQASLCELRYVRCFMPGCPTLVQARLLGLHLRRDCLKRRSQRILADKGKALDDEIACDACDERMPRKNLRAHETTGCPMRLVQCPNCNEAVQAKTLAGHQRQDCKTVKRTVTLCKKVANRPAEKECPACHETVVASLFRRHASDECPSRIVACPNKYLGCEEELPAAEMASHIRKQQCAVLIERNERASKYLFRRQRVQCSGCGYYVVLQHLLRHHREKCPNRRVPCKHWELGCPAMLRLSAMDDHLNVAQLLHPRACLAFDSGKAYIALGENDRKPPWTAEMWVWRPGLVEGTREKARTALKALWEFQRARGKLAITERRLAVLEPLLVEVATRAAKERTEEAEQVQNKLTDEMIAAATVRDDAKVDLVVSVVVLSNSVASAARGVEEITAHNRLRGFDRLALGSTPWYAATPSPSAGGGGRVGRDDGVPGKNRALPLEHSPPPALPITQVEQEALVELKEVTSEAKALPGSSDEDQTQRKGSSAGVPNSTPLEPDGATAGDENSLNDEKKDFQGMLSSIAKEQQVLEAAEEEASRKSEAGFWAEWVALSGASLGQRILALAGETLPKLKEEVVTITGLASKVLFQTPDDGATEEVEGSAVNNEAGGAQADKSTASKKLKGRNRKAEKKAKRKQKHEENFGKNIETRIAEEVGKRGGVETLLGSEKALFQLEMGPKERIGIKIAGKKDQIFNYRCPRERWVHLAFVSDSNGVFLLENGKTASRLRDVTVALPMREIGGRETACQCLIQEVRYWKVKRSKEDLTEWMHEVLPGTATKDGLIGYWTFEEGSGEHVNDVTDQRFRARKVGRGLKWAVSENMRTVEVGEPPTPSWRERNVCKVELRRGRLAVRGRLHRQMVSCPAGCGETFLKRNAKAHAAYRCPMRTVTCPMAACTKQMQAKDVPSHLEIYCAAHGSWVRMAEAGQELQELCSCPHCGEMVKRCNLKLHLKYSCHWVKEPCRNIGCGAFVPRIRRAEHEKRFCGASCAVRKRRRLARARALSKYRRDWVQDGE